MDAAALELKLHCCSVCPSRTQCVPSPSGPSLPVESPCAKPHHPPLPIDTAGSWPMASSTPSATGAHSALPAWSVEIRGTFPLVDADRLSLVVNKYGRPKRRAGAADSLDRTSAARAAHFGHTHTPSPPPLPLPPTIIIINHDGLFLCAGPSVAVPPSRSCR